MNFEIGCIIVAFLISFLISCVLYYAIITLIRVKDYLEKSSSYECGFHPFGDSRLTFNVRFYLVSILFLIFDLEIIFMFPWLTNTEILGIEVFFVILLFIIILLVGFIYEWIKGALIWE